MATQSLLKPFFKNQANLARILYGEVITRAARLKAHRIWHGIRIPNKEEMNVLNSASNGKIDANFFFDINPKKKKPKKLT